MIPDAKQILMRASVLPDGRGGFTVIPQKPIQEVSSKIAAQMLGVSPVTLHSLVNHPAASKILKWRWTSPRHGKRLWEAESLAAYRAATADPEFGAR